MKRLPKLDLPFTRLTVAERKVLTILYYAQRGIWVKIFTVKRVIQSLQRADLITSTVIDKRRLCQITLRGAAMVEEHMHARSHCRHCGQYIDEGNFVCANCRALAKSRWQGARQVVDSSICPRCKVAERAIHKSGRGGAYCPACHRDIADKRRVALYERVQAGEIILCKLCNTQPIWLSHNTRKAYYRCHDCMKVGWRHSEKATHFKTVLGK